MPLAWRRTYPVEAALVSAAFWLVPLDGYPLLGFVVVVLQFFSLGLRGEPPRAVAATTLVGVRPVGGRHLARARAPGRRDRRRRWSSWRRCSPVGWCATSASRTRHLADLTEELRDERDRAEQAAVGAERARIAQELHDVVGHEVTLIAIQAEAAGAALRLAPERAAEPIETIRSTAHRTLARDARGARRVGRDRGRPGPAPRTSGR